MPCSWPCFAIATNTGVRLLLRPTAGRALGHAFICAITIDVRIMGVLLPLATVALLAWRGVRGDVRWTRVASIGALYAVVLAGAVVAFWPYLWPAPLDNFLAAFEKMKTFRWGGTVLYRGSMVPATDLPWHYALVWLGITTPLLYLGTGLLGGALALYHVVRQRGRLWSDEAGLQDVFFLGLFAGPLLAVIALHSVLYDGWRQLYFILPRVAAAGLARLGSGGALAAPRGVVAPRLLRRHGAEYGAHGRSNGA